jgi:FG-GAP-like repeat
VPWPGWLEDRLLLTGMGADVLTLQLGSTVGGTMVPSGTTYYQIASDAGGKLIVTLEATGFAARISLVDALGNPLVQSDGALAGAVAIDVNVPAGSDFLEVQSLGGSGTYQLTANLTPTIAPFQTVPSLFTGASQLAEGDFNGDGVPDLIAPDGIHIGTGDGTFSSTVIDGPLGTPGWSVAAITVITVNGDALPEIAFTELSPDRKTAQLCILQDVDDGQLQPVDCLPVEPAIEYPDPIAIQPVDFGGGLVDLAVADPITGNVVIFTGDGKGSFAQGETLEGLDVPDALASGRFGDGCVDLVVAENGTGSGGDNGELTVFQAHGQDDFQATQRIDAGSGPSAVVTGDFTGNGFVDLAVANGTSDNVSILLNNGEGTFQLSQSYPVGSEPEAIVACDFGNGHLDLATANANSNDVSILLGNGDGTFSSQVRFAAGADPASLIAYDLNGDGRPDLAVEDLGTGAENDTGEITVLLGRGDGTFQDLVPNPVGDDPIGAATAQLSQNGYDDIITSNYYTDDISVLMGNGDGTFQPPETFPAGAAPTDLVVGDFNGDGLLDVAVADSGGGAEAGVSILMGNGNGTFQAPIPRPAGFEPYSIVAGYFTASKVLDLAVSSEGGDLVSILLGNGQGGFALQPPICLGENVIGQTFITSGDFGNGETDLAVANSAGGDVSILMGNGQGKFTVLPPIPLGTAPENEPSAIVAGDFAGGKSLDLAVASTSTDGPDYVTVLIGQGGGQFVAGTPIPLGTDESPTSITTGYFFGSTALDLAVADSNTNHVSLLRGHGTGEFDSPLELPVAAAGAPITIATGDFTNDARDDLVIALQSPNSVAIELNQGSGQFVTPDSVGLVPRNTPVVADFTGDGLPDIAIVNGAGDILFRQGVPNQPGTFEPPVPIDSDHPSRDIAAVITLEGLVLASVDADDSNVSLFVFRNGEFHLAGTLATGLEPAQIVSAELNRRGNDDLIIRNAGDGTLTIYLGNPFAGGFGPPITLTVGSGVSDVSVADLNHDGLGDILLANQTSGEVDVIMNQGGGHFSAPVLYRAGVGLSAVAGGSEGAPLSVISMDGTVGVVAVPGSAGSPGDIVALDAGADTLGVLIGLGGGQFANPYSLDTTGSTLAVSAVVLAGGGIYDLAILGPDGVTIWLGNGQGGFVQGATYNAGPDPTGLTIAYAEGNALPDLVIGNAYGDVLILVNQGNGLFSPPTITKDSVSLAVTVSRNGGSPTFVYSNQAGNSVNVQSGSLKKALGGPANGWLAPGALSLADLNGDRIPDLIVVDTGGNEVFVYPGLPGGKFGPALNNGNGFAVGTTPVAVTVANIDGRNDLLVANQGSNDVSVLLNKPMSNGSFTFVSGPRISAGFGPDGLLYGDIFGNGSDDLVVSDSSTNELMVIPSIGGGFFNAMNPMIIPLPESPGPLLPGFFGPGPGLDIVVLDPGTSEVTLISGLSGGSPTIQQIPSGGLDPVAAVTVQGSNGFDDLVVANNADGAVALLAGGPQGLALAQVNDSLDFMNPTGLAFASISNFSLEVYAATAGADSAILLGFSLGGLGEPSANFGGQALTLLSSSGSTLPLIATLLTPLVNLNAPEGEVGESSEGIALVAAQATATTTSLGQGPFTRNLAIGPVEVEGEIELDPTEAAPAEGAKAALPLWRRIEMGLDEAFDALRRANRQKASPAGGPDEDQSPSPPSGAEYRGSDESDDVAMIDAAIHSLASRVSLGLRWMATHERVPGYATFKTHTRPFPWQFAALALVQSRIVMTSARPPAQARLSRLMSRRRIGTRTKDGTRHRD